MAVWSSVNDDGKLIAWAWNCHARLGNRCCWTQQFPALPSMNVLCAWGLMSFWPLEFHWQHSTFSDADRAINWNMCFEISFLWNALWSCWILCLMWMWWHWFSHCMYWWWLNACSEVIGWIYQYLSVLFEWSVSKIEGEITPVVIQRGSSTSRVSCTTLCYLNENSLYGTEGRRWRQGWEGNHEAERVSG